MKRKLIAILLALIMVLCLLPTSFAPTTAAADTVETYALEHVQGGAILHCFNWSYKAIIDNLANIAAAGYTAVQTSPVQQPKDYMFDDEVGHTTSNEWWKLYQPLGFRVATSGETWLCEGGNTLADLCEAAHTYGVKVIVDIVANHVANKTGGGGLEQVNQSVDPELLADKERYFHSYTEFVNDGSRFNMTQYQMGMPDLNTEDEFVQDKVLGLLKECIDYGVDGFRFDAAKHIELPTDEGCASDFWPTVINGARSYALEEKNKELYIYGEILGGAGTAISNYTTYMAVTDNETGNSARVNAVNKNAYGLANYVYYKGAAPKDCVLWAESHDTFEDGASSGVSTTDIIRTWAIVGSRANSTSLFLARPGDETMGAAGDESWKGDPIREINKFKNHFDGTTEYVSAEGNVAYVERGTNGIVISKLDGGGSVELTVHKMKDGEYEDQITHGKFTVANGKITGTVVNYGVAVVYDPNESPIDYITVPTLYLKPNSEWTNDGARFAIYVYNSATGAKNWAAMTAADEAGYYQADVPEGEWTNVIFCRMNPNTEENNWDNKWNQTGDLFPDSGADLYTVKEGTWDNGGGDWSIYGYTPVENGGYYLIGNMTGWNLNEDYRLSANDSAQAEEYVIEDVNLTRTAQFKIIYSPDGFSKPDGNYYPQGMGNNYGQNGEITEDGSYTIYFRPNYDGGSDWFNNCLYAELTEEDPSQSLADGYYLIGRNGWTVDDIDPEDQFEVNPANSNEYMLNTTLVKGNQLKVVRVANGAIAQWYPDPGDNYTVDAAHSGTVTIYFQTTYKDDWSAFGGHIYIEVTGPCFQGHSLLLSGQIGVYFYMNLNMLTEAEKAASYMTFTISKGTVSEEPVNFSKYDEATQLHGFICYINSVQMAEMITATFHYGNGKEITETYTVEQYFTTFDKKESSYDKKTQRLVHSIADYGYHMQRFLSKYKGWELGTAYTEMTKHYTDAYSTTAVDVQAYAMEKTFYNEAENRAIKDIKHSLVLDSETTLCIYVEMASGYEGVPRIKIDNTAATVTQASGMYRAEIPGIAAHKLSTKHFVEVTVEDEDATADVYALSYLYALLTSDTYKDDPEAINAAGAIFEYSQAADDYRAKN